MADGRIYKGDYDADGRLTGLDVNSPGQLFVRALSVATGVPIAGTEEGAFCWDGWSWTPFAPSINNLRIISETPTGGRWLYGGDNELGWLHMSEGAVVIDERIAVPGLTKIYNAVTERSGRIWLELGAGKLGLVRFENGAPKLEVSPRRRDSRAAGPKSSRSTASFATTSLSRSSATARRPTASSPTSTEDSVPGMGNITGRPGVDAKGRLWITANGVVNILERKDGVWRRGPEALEVGFQPYYFTFEGNGVVWMHAMHRLARFDPNTPASEAVPLRAIITHTPEPPRKQPNPLQ